MFNIYYSIDDDFIINEQAYTADVSFDNMLRFIDLLNDPRIRQQSKVDTLLKMAFGQTFDELEMDYKIDVINKITDRYFKDDSSVVYDIKGNPMPKKTDQEDDLFDIFEDGAYIYASFMQVYGIDLIEAQGKLHYLKFKALLEGLPEESKLQQVIRIRSWNPDNEKMDHKQAMYEAKSHYKLKGVNIYE